MPSFLQMMLISLVMLTSACAHSIHQVHVSDFNPSRPISMGSLISASAEQQVVLGFAFDTNYVDKAYELLKSQCPKGGISGITTEYMTSLGFFSWTNKIFMKGRCI